jgi:hypothetical protein
VVGRGKRSLLDRDVVLLLGETLESPAWREMSHGAKALYVVLKTHCSPRERNNGKVVLPIRRAAQELGRSAHEDVVRWFRELQHFGFIVLKGEDKERRCCQWRLTELGYMREQPTREFARWDGTPFAKKTEPSPSNGEKSDRRYASMTAKDAELMWQLERAAWTPQFPRNDGRDLAAGCRCSQGCKPIARKVPRRPSGNSKLLPTAARRRSEPDGSR